MAIASVEAGLGWGGAICGGRAAYCIVLCEWAGALGGRPQGTRGGGGGGATRKH